MLNVGSNPLKKVKTIDWIYRIGLGLIIVGLVICIGYYTIIFGLPVIIIGTVLVVISKQKAKIKILSCVIPFILWVPVTSLIYYYSSRTTPLTFLIPVDFNGAITIVYNESCGIRTEMKDGRRIIEVPKNGLLIIQEEIESGRVDYEYFLVDKKGKQTTIPEIMYYETLTDSSKIGAGLIGLGGFGGPMPDGSSSSESKFVTDYLELFVLNPGHRERYHNYLTIQATVDSCRQRVK